MVAERLMLLIVRSVQLPEPVELTIMLQQSSNANGKVTAPVVQFVPGVYKNSQRLACS